MKEVRKSFYFLIIIEMIMQWIAYVGNNEAAAEAVRQTLWWVFGVYLVFVIIEMIFEIKNDLKKEKMKTKTVNKIHRKEIEEERANELTRFILNEDDEITIDKNNKVYTHTVDKPVEIVIKYRNH